MKKEKGITLIALVVTIIVLLILAAVSLNLVAGSDGILRKTTRAVDMNEKATAEEQADLLLNEIAIEYYEKKYVNRESLDELDNYLQGELGSGKETATGEFIVITDGNKNLQVMKDNNIIATGKIENGKVIWLDEIKPIDPTIKTFEELLSKNGINKNYTKQDVANNKDGILEKILKNPYSIEYIFENFNEYGELFTSSEEAMDLLGKNIAFKNKIITSEDWQKAIANSTYQKVFSEYLIYNAGETVGKAGGRDYTKLNEGFALSGACYRGGALFILISNDSEAVLGWSSYNPSVYSPYVRNLEYKGNVWYYAELPYCWTDGTGFHDSSFTNCKYIGEVNSEYDAVMYILNDFLGTDESE